MAGEEENNRSKQPESTGSSTESEEQKTERERIEKLLDELFISMSVIESMIDSKTLRDVLQDLIKTLIIQNVVDITKSVALLGIKTNKSPQWETLNLKLREFNEIFAQEKDKWYETIEGKLPQTVVSQAPASTTEAPIESEEPFDLDKWLQDATKHPQIAKNFSQLVEDLHKKLTDPKFDPEQPYLRGRSAITSLLDAIRNFEEFIQIGKQRGGDEFDKMNGLKSLYIDPAEDELLQKLYDKSYEIWEQQVVGEQVYVDIQRLINYSRTELIGLDKGKKQELATNKKDLTRLSETVRQEIERLSTETTPLNNKKVNFWRRLLAETMAILTEMDEKYQELSQPEKINGWTEESVLKIPAVRAAAEFFGGGFTPDILPNYQDLEWLRSTPEKLACAIWFYVNNTVMDIKASGDKLFIPMQLFSWELPFGDKNSLGKLLESFGNLGLLYPNNPENTNKFRNLAGKLAVDFGRIEKIHELGSGVHEREAKPESLIEWLTTKEHSLDSEELERISKMGAGYLDKEGYPLHRDRLLWGMQAWMFINDPEKVDVAVLDNSTDEQPVFARNVLIRSPLTLYPTVIEGKVDDRKLLESLIQRRLIRKIVGSLNLGEKPPWILDPEWKQKNGESLSALATRRLLLGRSYMQEMLYGRRGVTKPFPGSFHERWRKELSEHTDTSNIDQEEKKEVQAGFTAEQQIGLLMEYFLMPAKAEGLKETARSRRERDPFRRKGVFREIDGKAGPTADFYIARTLVSPQMYSRKLLDTGGGDGSHGPANTKDKWFKFFETFLDRYYFLPDNEEEGQTLREAIINCESGEDFGSIPYSQAITTAEENLAWSKQLELGWLYTDIVMGKGLGVDWHRVVSVEPGTAITVFNPQTAEVIKKKLSRNAYYSLTRDFGREVTRWPDDESFAAFRAAEDDYLNQRSRGVAIKDTVPPAGVSAELWEDVKKYSRKPSANHQLVDGRNLSNRTSSEVVRYATNVFDMVWVPDKQEDMNSFEKAVILSGKNDWATIIQKLIVGNLFMGDVFRSESANSMTVTDIIAFFKLFSQEYWERGKGPKLFQDFSRMMAGRSKDPEYNGLGYFDVEEVSAMLQEASVGTGPSTWFRGLIENAQKIGK